MHVNLLSRLSDLTGRVALITGAAGHLGRLFSCVLQEQGAKVYGIDRPENIHNVTNGVIPLAIELTDKDAISRIVKALEAEGRLDIIINNAAFVGTDKHIGWCVPLTEQSIDTWRDCLEVNLTIPFAIIQALTPLLSANGQGVIVNVGSIYGAVGPDWRLYEGTEMGNPAAYAASKGGLHQLTRWLATTLAPDIRVNTLVPGGIFRYQDENFLNRYVNRTPMRRMANEEDMAGAILYLCSDLSSYVTGHELPVDGGWQIW